MFKKLLLLAWVVMIGVTLSCKGPDGDVGPAGAKGDKGDTGATGATGPAGTSDTTGSGPAALILTTDAFTTDSLGNAGFYYEKFFEGLSADGIASVENGAVLVYIKSGGSWFAVPGLVIFPDKSSGQYSFYYGVDGTDFYFQILRLSSSTGSTIKKTFEDIRIVLVPGTNLGRMDASVNWKSYDAALAALGLTEKDVKAVKARPSLVKR